MTVHKGFTYFTVKSLGGLRWLLWLRLGVSMEETLFNRAYGTKVTNSIIFAV